RHRSEPLAYLKPLAEAGDRNRRGKVRLLVGTRSRILLGAALDVDRNRLGGPAQKIWLALARIGLEGISLSIDEAPDAVAFDGDVEAGELALLAPGRRDRHDGV